MENIKFNGSKKFFAIATISMTIFSTGTLVGSICNQASVETALGTKWTEPTHKYFIHSNKSAPIRAFYDWESDNGYCGESSMMSAARQVAGTWMSQFNSRLVCGSGLSQSGPDGWCVEHKSNNYNAQLTLESPNTGVTGPNPYSYFTQCGFNARLEYDTFDYQNQSDGISGFQEYMSWIKRMLINGKHTTIGTLARGLDDSQYDHIVTVLAVGTNHDTKDASYYPDDVLYIDDHGTYSFQANGKIQWGGAPAIPSSAGCTPFVFSFTFESLAQTRRSAQLANSYSIVIPSSTGKIETGAGANGYDTVTIIGPKNYGFAISGPMDEEHTTLPVMVTIDSPTFTNGVENPRDPVADWNYENPYIGSSDKGISCTNTPPTSWMAMTLTVTVSELTPGVSYNLYRYTFGLLNGGNEPLQVPSKSFNKHADQATAVLNFKAENVDFVVTFNTSSDKVEIFRVVPTSAP